MTDETTEGYGIDSFSTHGVLAVLTDERMAEPNEHPASGAVAYTVELYDCEADPSDGDPVFSTTYTVGPRVTPQADARNALHSLALDAQSLEGAKVPEDARDITDPEVRRAIADFSSMYGHKDTADLLEVYSGCVEARDALRRLGLDYDGVTDLYEATKQ